MNPLDLKLVTLLGLAGCMSFGWAAGVARGEETRRTEAPAPAPLVVTAVPDETPLPIVRLSAVLESEGVTTTDDLAGLLGRMLPPSVRLLSGNRIAVTSAEHVTQFTMETDRGGVLYRVPDSEATAEDGPPTEVLRFTGQIGDLQVTGTMFVAGDLLVLDLEWWGADGRILLGESVPWTIRVSRADGSPVADDGPVLEAPAPKWICKCENSTGACGNDQCTRMIKCYTDGAKCRWFWQT